MQVLTQALPLLEAAYGSQSREVARCRGELARAYYQIGEDARALEAASGALTFFERDATDQKDAAAMLNHELCVHPS